MPDLAKARSDLDADLHAPLQWATPRTDSDTLLEALGVRRGR